MVNIMAVLVTVATAAVSLVIVKLTVIATKAAAIVVKAVVSPAAAVVNVKAMIAAHHVALVVAVNAGTSATRYNRMLPLP
jgi:hypothetical protein